MNEIIARPTDKPVRQSLCCLCGTLRTVSANFAPRGEYTSYGESAEHIAEMQQYDIPYWRDREPYRRCLENLKCATCRRITEHAMVFPASRPDVNEEQQAEDLQAWQRAYDAAQDVASLTGARIDWCERRSSSGKVVASLLQYLDDGEWFLTVYDGSTAQEATDALHKLYMHLLTDDAKWYVTGPDPLDPGVIPHRGLAYSRE